MDDSKTVLARPFPLSTTEERVKTLFESLGRVKRVKLRRDEGNQAFRGSVYVEFEGHDTAAAAVSNPPLRPNSKTEQLEVILKTEYLRQKQQSHARQPQNGSKAHKRARHSSSTGQQQGAASSLPPLPPVYNPQQPDMDLEEELMAYASGDVAPAGPSSSTQAHHQQQFTQQSGVGYGGRAAHAADAANALRRMQEAEQALAVQRDQNSTMLNRLLTAQAAAEDAQSREVQAARKLLAKEAEIGSLKGEVEAAKSMARARAESIQGQFKARIHDLEVQVHQLKDDNNFLRRERDQADARTRAVERKLKALTAAGAGAAAASVAAPSKPSADGSEAPAVKAEAPGKNGRAAAADLGSDDDT